MDAPPDSLEQWLAAANDELTTGEDTSQADTSASVRSIVLSTLVAWCLAHVLLLPSISSGLQLTISWAVLVLSSAAAVIAVIAAARFNSPSDSVITGALCVVALAPSVVAALTGVAWAGLDVAVVFVAAAVVVAGRQTLIVVGAGLAGWVLAAALSVVAAQGSTSTEPGEVTLWLLCTAAIAAGAGVAWAVSSYMTALHQSIESVRRESQANAMRDSLTGLVTRRGLEMVAEPMVEHAWRAGQAVHGLYISVDDMRAVNMSLGLTGGDEVLNAVARAIGESVRGTDIAARWDSDEFVIVGPGTGVTPREMEHRIRGVLKDNDRIVKNWSGSISVGVATLVPWDDTDLLGMVARAERDMQLRRSLRRNSEANMAGPQAKYANRDRPQAQD